MQEAINIEEEALEEDIEQDQYLIFIVRGQEFGIQAMRIQEITAVMDIAQVPNAPQYIEGILNLRGRLLSLINFRKRFGFESKGDDEDTRIIIVEHLGFPVGIIVDVVEEVIKIPVAKTQQMPPTVSASMPEGIITGVGLMDKRLIILLDVDKILNKTYVVEPGAMHKIIENVQTTQAEGEKQ